MDKAAERPPLRPSVPRLHLSTFNPDTPQHCDLESLQLTTCRSDTEDFILPTSFRTSRAKNDSVEKIPGQLERLTGLIDNMMDNLKDAEDSKSLEDMQLASRDFICQLSTTDSCSVLDLERAFMSLEDASASELRHREEKLDLQRVLRDTQLQLDLALKMDRLEVEMQSGASVSSLQHRFDEMRVQMQEVGILFDSATLTRSEHSELHKSLQQLKDKEMTETLIITELKQLKRHVENLSNQRLNSLTGNWELEFPVFCKNLLQVISSLSQRKEMANPEVSKDLMKVTCSATDLHGVLQKLQTILEDFDQCGEQKEFGIQLGMMGVTVVVEGDSEPEDCCFPQQLASVLSDQITYQGEVAQTDRPTGSGERKNIDPVSYIHQLEEKVVELQGALMRQEELLDVDANSMHADLESKLEEVMYKLALANKQIEKLKQGKYAPDEEHLVHNYKLKLGETLLREEKLKENCSKLALEREKLRLQVLEFESEKSKLLSEHEAALQELAAALESTQKEQIDSSIQVSSDLRVLELEQTCKALEAQLQEESNKSRLLLESQQVMRKSEGRWTHLGSGKKLLKQIKQVYKELEKGFLDPAKVPNLCKSLRKVKDKLELLASKQLSGEYQHIDCEEIRADPTGLGSIFSLSQDESSDLSWPSSPVEQTSPHFSMSRIEQPEIKPDLSAELKQKEAEIEDLHQELENLKNLFDTVQSELVRLKEERLLLLKKDDELQSLKAKIEEFMSVRVVETQQLDAERQELDKLRSILDEEKDSFRHKRALLREKVEQVNDRQKKLQERDKLLTEKQTLLLLQEKKMECHKQAIDEEWARIDEKRHEVLKCHRVIDDEWKVLLEETKQFEALKVADKKIRGEMKEVKEMESLIANRERDLERDAEKMEIINAKLGKEREAMDREKEKLREERTILEEERAQLIRTKKSIYDKMKQCQMEKSEVSLDRMSVAKQKKDVEDNRRDLALMIPALQKLLNPSSDL